MEVDAQKVSKNEDDSAVKIKSLKEKYDEWKEEQNASLRVILLDKLPKNIIHLTEVAENIEKSIISMRADSGASKDEWFYNNTDYRLDEYINSLRTESFYFMELSNQIRLGIKLSFPALSTGIPFEMDIKSELMQHLSRVEKVALTLVGGFETYYTHRGDLIKKHEEHPNIEDYLEFIRNMDSEGLADLKIWLRKLTYIQLAVQESLLKNFVYDGESAIPQAIKKKPKMSRKKK